MKLHFDDMVGSREGPVRSVLVAEQGIDQAVVWHLVPDGRRAFLDMGLVGWAMSRYTGRWVGFKTIAETVESSASVDVDPQ